VDFARLRLAARSACLLAWLPLAGCASLGLGLARLLPDAARECPGRLLPAEQIQGDFRVRQRARVQNDEGLDWRLELIAEKRADLLVLVGLDTFGGKLFAVTQRGSRVRVERPRGRLPRPPADLLRDFQRTRLAAEAAPEPGVQIERPQPGEVSIEHGRCGYRTRLVTLEEAPL
jgi:hypothetical protein